MITPASRSFWVREAVVPLRTRAYQPVSMELLLLADKTDICTLTATLCLRNAKQINWPRLPAPPATATTHWDAAISKGFIKEIKCLDKAACRWER